MNTLYTSLLALSVLVCGSAVGMDQADTANDARVAAVHQTLMNEGYDLISSNFAGSQFKNNENRIIEVDQEGNIYDVVNGERKWIPNLEVTQEWLKTMADSRLRDSGYSQQDDVIDVQPWDPNNPQGRLYPDLGQETENEESSIFDNAKTKLKDWYAAAGRGLKAVPGYLKDLPNKAGEFATALKAAPGRIQDWFRNEQHVDAIDKGSVQAYASAKPHVILGASASAVLLVYTIYKTYNWATQEDGNTDEKDGYELPDDYVQSTDDQYNDYEYC